jgi:sec-independent protein translocase protein TatC
MAILASMITPGDAITATFILMGPLLLLYEVSIVLARMVERGRLKAADEEALEAGPG